MTEEIICRYKFHNNEKFNGKEYCTLFNEVCSDVEFVCDKNCQVYEDYKQLKRLEQENKELKSLNKKICEDCSKEIKVYWNALEEIRKIAKDIIENDVYENSDVKAEKILDRINEVLNESK